jgi:hypothetical protein
MNTARDPRLTAVTGIVLPAEEVSLAIATKTFHEPGAGYIRSGHACLSVEITDAGVRRE